MIEGWANENAGSIELTGNLAAVGQRHLAIKNQVAQIAALQSLAEAQRRQQIENALLQERQNILYDISGALEDIKQSFERQPSKAYFDFLVLEEFVSSLSLEHRLFPSLEWKNHCDKTLAGIRELRSWCDTSLDARVREAGAGALAQRKLEAKLREEEEVRKRNAKREAQRLAERQVTWRRVRMLSVMGLCCLGLGLVCLMFAIDYARTHRPPPGENQRLDIGEVIDLSNAFGFLAVVGGAVCGIVALRDSRELERERKMTLYKLVAAGLVIGILASLVWIFGDRLIAK